MKPKELHPMAHDGSPSATGKVAASNGGGRCGSAPSVLLVGQGFRFGGAEVRFTRIATHLFGGNADVAVLLAADRPAAIGPTQLIDLDWHGWWSYFRASLILARRVRAQRYDVVMAFGFTPNLLALLSTMAGRSGTKVVISEISRPRLSLAGSTWWRRVVYEIVMRTIYRRADRLTANSIDGLREICEIAGVPVSAGVRVPNVVDARDYENCVADHAPPRLAARQYVICVGRLDRMKRLDVVIEALALLDTPCPLVIVGDGPARGALEEQVAAAGVLEHVHFAGWLADPHPLMKGAAAFVLASEYEGFSNALLEAMFCDVPVLTSLNTADAYEMCREGAALGFPVGQADALAGCLSLVLGDARVGQRLVARAQKYRETHELRNAIPLYEQLVREVACAR